MNFIGRFKLSKIIKDRPEAEPAISAWLKEQSQPFSEQSFIGGRRGPFWGSCSPFGKLHINYHINPPVRTGYIIYAGFDNKGIPPQVTMPEMEESLIRETISIVIGDGQRKETVVRKLVPNDMRDEDYPIPRAEVPLASQKMNLAGLTGINSEAEYKSAFYRAVMIFDSELNTNDYKELQFLIELISEYENKHFHFRDISFVEILKMRLEEMRYTDQMLAEDLRVPLEDIRTFLSGGTSLPNNILKKISRRFKIAL